MTTFEFIEQSKEEPATDPRDAEWKPGLIGSEVYDKQLQCWRTVVEQKRDGRVRVKDDDFGDWLTRDEYEITLTVDENCSSNTIGNI
jgi:hypothetical protein